MITGFGIESFKSLNTYNYFPFKKYNILLGPNSSGKSSYIKALILLRNTWISKDNEPSLILDDVSGDYKSLISNHNIKNKLSFVFSFSNSNFEEIFNNVKLSNLNLFVRAAFKFTNNPEMIPKREIDNLFSSTFEEYKKNPLCKYSVKIKQTAKKPNTIHECIFTFQNSDKIKIISDRNALYLEFNDRRIPVANIVTPYKFIVKIDESKMNQINPQDIKTLLNLAVALKTIEFEFEKFFKSISHIEPFRKRPDRTVLIANFKYNSVESDGGNIVAAVMGLEDKHPINTTIKKKMTTWLNNFEIAKSVSVEELSGNQYSLKIKNKNTNIESNIVDVGVGTSQLLPIIVECVLSKKNSILIIEEPESHIHPNAQAQLGELFQECGELEGKQFFVETHSMYLIQQLQILVAERKINPADLGVFYFSQVTEGTTVKNFQLSQNGNFQEDFPKGFFDVAYELSKKLLLASMNSDNKK